MKQISFRQNLDRGVTKGDRCQFNGVCLVRQDHFTAFCWMKPTIVGSGSGPIIRSPVICVKLGSGERMKENE